MKEITTLLSPSWFRKYGLQTFTALDSLFSEEAFFITDVERKIVFWSKGAEKLLHFSKKEAVGEHCLKTNRCVQCMRNCGVKLHKRIDGLLLELYDKEGSVVPVKKYAQILSDRNGEFAGTFELLKPLEKSKRPSPSEQEEFHGMLSCAPAMKKLFQQIRAVAKTDAPVLARGESGTGKELLAKAIHLESPRAKKPFIAINCSAIPQNLIESELFGHKKGAFTGAYQDRKGLFTQADGGSLFLDEIAELPLTIQTKLLRVLETQEFVPIGAEKSINVDVRVLTATHKSLREEVSQGRFRQDLMYRLRVVPLFLPPLREREGDIELLLWHFISRAQKNGSRYIKTLPPSTRERLLSHSWPGNIRELKNVVDYALAIGQGDSIHLHDLPPEFRETSPQPEKTSASIARPPSPQVFYTEEERIREALRMFDGHLGKTADFLGISRPTLWRKRKKYDL